MCLGFRRGHVFATAKGGGLWLRCCWPDAWGSELEGWLAAATTEKVTAAVSLLLKQLYEK